MREREPPPDARQLRTIAAGAEQPNRRKLHILRHGAHSAKRVAFGEGAVFEQQQLLKALQKIVIAPSVLASPQRIGGDGVGAWGAAQPKVDAPREECFQHLEPFGHHERRVVRQHHAAGTHAHPFGGCRNLPDHDVGGGACNRRQVVMLGDPRAREAEMVRKPREIERIAQRHRARRAGSDRGEIEDGERNHRACGALRQNGHGRRRRQSCFQPVRRPRRNWSASPVSTA